MNILVFTIISLSVLVASVLLMLLVAYSQKMMTIKRVNTDKNGKTNDEKEKNLLDKFAEKLTRPFVIKPFYVLLIGFAIAAGIFLIPFVASDSELIDKSENWFTRALVVVHNVIKLFVVDSDFALITKSVGELAGVERVFITAVGASYYVCAPVFTAVSLLSFVKDIFSVWKIRIRKRRAVYIFSELNDMTVSVAKDIVKNEDGSKTIIFTDVYKDDDEKNRELILTAQRLGGICLSRDLVELKASWFRKNRIVKYYCLGKDQDENMKHALKLIGRYKILFSKRRKRLVAKIDEAVKILEGFKNDEKYKEIEEAINKQFNIIKKSAQASEEQTKELEKLQKNIEELIKINVKIDILLTYKEAVVLGARKNSHFKHDNKEEVEKDKKRTEKGMLELLPYYEQFTSKKVHKSEFAKEGIRISSRASKITNKIKTRRCEINKPEIYVFAANAESEALLDNAEKDFVHVRRINENRDLVFETMTKNSVFSDVNEQYAKLGKADAEEKEMNVAIVGLGGYGMELLKTLSWLGQAKGYYLNAYVFDNENGTEKVRIQAPELLEYNYLQDDETLDKHGEDKEARGKIYPNFVLGETKYSIHFYNSIDVNSTDFITKINDINSEHPLTSVYVTLGNDSLNVQTAINIRRVTARNSTNSFLPRVYAVVFNTNKTDVLTSSARSGGYNYDITFIGNIDQAFSKTTIEQNEIEKIGFDYHVRWESVKTPYSVRRSLASYDKLEYNRKSSMAQAFFYKLLKQQGVVYENFIELAICEHNRWNAFMRAEGFVYNSSKDTKVKKTHCDLKNFFDLKVLDQLKDCAFYQENDIIKVTDTSFMDLGKGTKDEGNIKEQAIMAYKDEKEAEKQASFQK